MTGTPDTPTASQPDVALPQQPVLRVGDPVVIAHGWDTSANRSVFDFAGTLRRINGPDGDVDGYMPDTTEEADDDEERVSTTIQVEGPDGQIVDSDLDRLTHHHGRPTKVSLTYMVPVDVEVDLVQGRVTSVVVADERLDHGAPTEFGVAAGVQLAALIARDVEWPAWVIGN